jgi:hypothetical protein
MNDDQKFDIYYGYAFHELCQSFYARLDFVVTFTQLVGGSGAAAGVLTTSPWLVGVSGVVLAICAAVGVTVQPAIKAYRHELAKCQFWGIKARGDAGLAGGELTGVITQAQGDSPMGIKTLEDPAYNRALRMLGYEKGYQELKGMRSLLECLAG